MNTKPSMTLRFLESHEVFTLDEFMTTVDPDVSKRTRETNLRNAVQRKQVRRLARGLYASNVGAFRDKTPNVLLVGSKAAPDSVLAYHTALEAHGVAHTPARTVYFLSAKTMAPFTVRGYRFRRVAAKAVRSSSPDKATYVTDVRAGDVLVAATTRERTLVDCLARLDLAGGLEELLRSAGSFTTMTSEHVARYSASLGSPTLAARAGWLLELMSNDWLCDPAPLDQMRRSLGRGTYWLQPRRHGVEYEFVSAWRLYVPAGLPFLDWLRG
jgi:predicted transcriptional regulator of viral defense system